MDTANEIIEKIRKEIAALQPSTVYENFGHVLSLGDGVVFASGLSQVKLNEKVQFADGSLGLALNLAEDCVGIVVLSDGAKINVGDEVKSTGELLCVPVGKALLGRVVNGLGEPIDGRGPIAPAAHYPVEKIAPGILPRQSVSQPLQTGVIAIDSMIPIGRGQRELIIGDRATGKTSIAIDVILNQAKINRQVEVCGDPNFRPVYSIYVAIGQRRSAVAKTIQLLESHGALSYTIILAEDASNNPVGQYIAPYAGTAMGEWFMDNGMDALIVYDDLSKHAVAYRQISLVLKRPAGRQAYPGDIFYLHSRLLERSARLNRDNGGGSLTALPIVETQEGDVSAYIPTNIISITDGQIYLDTDLFNRGVRPAVATGISVSRVGSAAQVKAFKQVAGKIKMDLGQYYELMAFAQFGSELDERTQQQLDRGARIVELFKQPKLAPKSMEMQVFLLWAMQNGFFDKIAIGRTKAAVDDLEQWALAAEVQLLEDIAAKKEIDDAVGARLHHALESWQAAQEGGAVAGA
ncbi:MAG: F0F1 ATP synthase subunit alpha [Puniceicoccales bacterium]|jgi:F-type H+-transporting ATPase subunit alpha|nr:F0F1 ATP synthase subunit alpha [Puniceicoccales bacterium]